MAMDCSSCSKWLPYNEDLTYYMVSQIVRKERHWTHLFLCYKCFNELFKGVYRWTTKIHTPPIQCQSCKKSTEGEEKRNLIFIKKFTRDTVQDVTYQTHFHRDCFEVIAGDVFEYFGKE